MWWNKNKALPTSHVIYKYLTRELFIYFSIAFLFFFAVFFVNQILLTIEELLKQRVPMKDVIRLIWYSLPSVVATSAPFATLVGFLMCLGRFVSDNEILVLRSTGHNYFSIFLPVIILSLGISVVSFVVNDYLLPLGNLKYNELTRQIMVTNPAVQLESNSVKRTKNSTLVIGTVKDTTVSDLVLFDFDDSGEERVIVAGKTDIIAPEDPAVIMQLEMENPSVVFFDNKNYDNYDYMLSDSAIMNIFESSIDTSSGYLNPREMTFVDLKTEFEKMKESSVISMIMLNYYEMELHKKFSLPFGSLFFAFLAMPVALLFGKKNGQTVGLIIGIVVCVLYWAIMILGQTWGQRQGRFAFGVMWAPNALMGFGGTILYFKLRKK